MSDGQMALPITNIDMPWVLWSKGKRPSLKYAEREKERERGVIPLIFKKNDERKESMSRHFLLVSEHMQFR